MHPTRIPKDAEGRWLVDRDPVLHLWERLEEEVRIQSEAFDHGLVEPVVVVRQIPMEDSDGRSDPFDDQSGNDLLVVRDAHKVCSVNTVLPLGKDARPGNGHPEGVEAKLV